MPIGSSGCPVARPGGSELAEQPDEVPLGDAELECWPCEDSRQRMSVCGSSANQSMRSPMFHTPAWLIQPPRFVDEATSGETVTTRAATSGVGAREVDEEASERLLGRGAARVHTADVARHGARLAQTAAGRDGAAPPPRRQSSASGVPGANAAHGSAMSAPSSRASCAHCSSDMSAEWLAGWPCVGSHGP